MRLVLNLLWLVLGGVWLFVAYLVAGVIMCLTVIGIPFGVQSFKLAGFALWPFGRSVVARPNASVSLSLVANVVWVLLAGIWLAVAHLVVGVMLCLTIVGIPLGLGSVKLVPLAIAPFGRDIVPTASAGGRTEASF